MSAILLNLSEREAHALDELLADWADDTADRVREKLARVLPDRNHSPIPGQMTVDDFIGGGAT